MDKVLHVQVWGPEFNTQNPYFKEKKLGMVVHACNLSPGEAEIGGSLGLTYHPA